MDHTDYMDDERLALYEQQRAEARRADASQLGLVGMSLLPAAALVGVLCGVLNLVIEQYKEQKQLKSEVKCLEEAILNATARAQTGKIIPVRELLGVNERG